MAIKLDFSQLLDPRDNRLPKKTGIGGKLKPFPRKQLFNPKLVANPALRKQLAVFNPTNPKVIRADFMKKLGQAVDTINRHLAGLQQFKGVRFEVDANSKRSFALVRDLKSGEVLRQIPPEGVLQIAASLRDASGLIVSREG